MTGKSLKGKKIIIEFSDPNPFKEFHIGHVYSTIMGEAISRLLESQGARVIRTIYHGDIGLHVAKAIWGWQKIMRNHSEDLQAWKVKGPEAQIMELGFAYSTGAKEFEEKDQARKEINDINKKIYEKSDKEINLLYEEGKKASLEYFGNIYKLLGTKFQESFFESKVAEIGAKLVTRNNKIFKKSEGAWIFEGEKYGLHNRVFVNSQGLPTYEAKELGLAFAKKQKFGHYDQSIIITGNEIVQYFKVVLAALKLIDPEIERKTKHIPHGIVRLAGGKISSRLRNLVTWEMILKYAVNGAYDRAMRSGVIEKSKNEFVIRSSSIRGVNREVIDRQVGIGAIKYGLLKNHLGQDIEFNFDTSISLGGDSGPYIQYTYVRTRGVLANQDTELLSKQTNQVIEKEDLIVLRVLSKYADIVEEAAINYSPNILCSYLFSLAQKFNLLYQKHRISNNKLRLKITGSTGEVIKNGLNLLGIEAPEGM